MQSLAAMIDEAELDGAVSDLPEVVVVLDQRDGLAGERLVDVDELTLRWRRKIGQVVKVYSTV